MSHMLIVQLGLIFALVCISQVSCSLTNGLKGNPVRVANDDITIENPYLGISTGDTSPPSLNSHIAISGLHTLNGPQVLKNGAIVNERGEIAESSGQPPLEDLDEDDDDRFITTRKGKLRVRYINLDLDMEKEKHIEPYSIVKTFAHLE